MQAPRSAQRKALEAIVSHIKAILENKDL
jgi:hypothetical protein